MRPGLPVRSDTDLKSATVIARYMLPLRDLARSSLRDIDPKDDLVYFRIQTKLKEYFISFDEQYTLITIQKLDTSIDF